MDPDVYQFSSGVCWRRPVPSAINPPPHPHPDSWCSVSVAAGCEIGHLHPPPTPSLLGVAVCCEVYAGRLSFLPFSTEERQKDSLTLDFQGLFSEKRSRLQKSICTSRNYYPHNKETFVNAWCVSPLKRSVSIN